MDSGLAPHIGPIIKVLAVVIGLGGVVMTLRTPQLRNQLGQRQQVGLSLVFPDASFVGSGAIQPRRA